MNLNLNLDVKALLKIAQALQAYLFGLLLVGAFGYTAYVINGALNVKADPALADPTVAKPTKIVFDKNVIAALKQLSTVSGDVPTGNLGSTDPF